MKKWILLSLFTVSCFIPWREAQAANVGLHGGVNFMSADVTASNADTGFLFGAMVEAPLAVPVLYLQAELNLNRVGAENNLFGGFGTTRFTFVEIPVLLKAKAPIGDVDLFAEAGPKAALLVHTSGNVASGARENFELGAYVGAGVGIDVSRTSQLSFTGRYAIGFTDLDTSAATWRTRGFQLLAGLTF